MNDPGKKPTPTQQPPLYIDRLRDRLGKSWPAIARAADEAERQRVRIADELGRDGAPTSSDADIVVFGALARGEWTRRSDVDWTLLIDGQVDPNHRYAAHEVEKRLRDAGFVEPAAGGTFGTMAFSHEIIHRIGGQADSNTNTTQRVLLLLESARIHFEPEGLTGAHERVVRNILYRYLLDDTNLVSEAGAASKVPRFLLNDIVRFWRTMCVDFAYKQWEQAGRKWALRNVKLRMSRKLIFVSGLLLCASGYLEPSIDLPSPGGDPGSRDIEPLLARLLRVCQMPPLEVVAHALLNYGADATAGQFMDSYDAFVALLDDDDKRQWLEDLDPSEAYKDSVYNDCRGLSHRFQEAITRLFFEDHSELTRFTQTYGVF